MSMTRNDFNEIAETVKRQREWADSPEELYGVERLVKALCGDFKQSNRSFDRDRFLKACGMEQAS